MGLPFGVCGASESLPRCCRSLRPDDRKADHGRGAMRGSFCEPMGRAHADPLHGWTAVITTCGWACYQRQKISVSQVFAGQKVGVKQTGDHVGLVTFTEYDLGDFDDDACRLEPNDNPLGPKLLPMSPEWTTGSWSLRSDSNRRPADHE